MVLGGVVPLILRKKPQPTFAAGGIALCDPILIGPGNVPTLGPGRYQKLTVKASFKSRSGWLLTTTREPLLSFNRLKSSAEPKRPVIQAGGVAPVATVVTPRVP